MLGHRPEGGKLAPGEKTKAPRDWGARHWRGRSDRVNDVKRATRVQPGAPFIGHLFTAGHGLGPPGNALIHGQRREIIAVRQFAARQCGHPVRVRGQQDHVAQRGRCCVAPFKGLVQPARDDLPLKVRVQHQALLHGGVGPVQVIVDQTTVPMSAWHRTRDVSHRFEPERDRARGLNCLSEVLPSQRDMPGWLIAQWQRQGRARRGENRAL